MKYCEVGGHEVERLWIAKGKTKQSACQSCARKTGKPISRSQKPIAKLTKKRQLQNKVYLTLRKIYLESHPFCKAHLQGCTLQSTEIHHRAGKIGSLLTDIRNFVPICRNCHSWTELHPAEAKSLQLSTNRLDK